MIKRITLGLMAALMASQVAVAGPDCTSEPQTEWMSVMDMQKKIINDYGYAISMFKVTDGNCYEIYGYEPIEAEEDAEEKKASDEDKGGVEDGLLKVEIYFNPLDGEIVKKKTRD